MLICWLSAKGGNLMKLEYLLLRRSLWAICLASAVGAAAHDHTPGWYFSRANCLGANESITWKIEDPEDTSIAAVILAGRPIPPDWLGVEGLPAWRRTTSIHTHRYVSSKDHYHQSAPAMEWTWRAHAGSFPLPEAFPYVEVRWVLTAILVPIILWEDGMFPTVKWVIHIVLLPEIFVDDHPWRVAGVHYEGATEHGGTSKTRSWASRCNWEHTYRPIP